MIEERELSAEAVLDRLTHDRYDENRETRYRARAYLGEAVRSDRARRVVVVVRKRRELKR
jgi:hypothetical protein